MWSPQYTEDYGGTKATMEHLFYLIPHLKFAEINENNVSISEEILMSLVNSFMTQTGLCHIFKLQNTNGQNVDYPEFHGHSDGHSYIAIIICSDFIPLSQPTLSMLCPEKSTSMQALQMCFLPSPFFFSTPFLT